MKTYIAKQRGFDGMQIREPGEKFQYEGKPGKWMTEAGSSGAPKAGTYQGHAGARHLKGRKSILPSAPEGENATAPGEIDLAYEVEHEGGGDEDQPSALSKAGGAVKRFIKGGKAEDSEDPSGKHAKDKEAI